MTRFNSVLFFPVTPFDAADRLAEDVYAEHVDRGVAAGAGAVFAACGTGELHALDVAEHATVVEVAAKTAAGRVPVYAGAGGPLPTAIKQVQQAAELGADGILLLPPYLVRAPAEGLRRYVQAVAEKSELPIIIYSRANAVFDPASVAELAALENVVGLKDGHGNLELMARTVAEVHRVHGRDFAFEFFNGLPTAEMSQPAYRAIGVPMYSSAVYCFLPELSLTFYRALQDDDVATVERLLTEFFGPFVALRSKREGYAISLVKAGVRLTGLPVGSVRPPIVEPSPEHLDTLAELIEVGQALAKELS